MFPGAYLVPDLFRRYLGFLDAIESANVGLYLVMIRLEAAVIME